MDQFTKMMENNDMDVNDNQFAVSQTLQHKPLNNKTYCNPQHHSGNNILYSTSPQQLANNTVYNTPLHQTTNTTHTANLCTNNKMTYGL